MSCGPSVSAWLTAAGTGRAAKPAHSRGTSKSLTGIEPDLGGINYWDLEGFADWGRCATVGVFRVEFTVQMRPYDAVPG